MNDLISQVKTEFTNASERLKSCLISTPEDKINWAPSETARSPLQLVACGAMGTAGMKNTLSGEPFPFSSMQEMDATNRANEKKIKTKEEALKLLNDTSTEYLNWLDTLTPEKLNTVAKMPMGDVPMKVAISYPAGHLHCRACQLDYIQTIYGDLTWHIEKR